MLSLLPKISVALLFANGAVANNDAWDLKKLTSFVTFGNSYTDESRLGYFINNNGSAPPVGYIAPEVRCILQIHKPITFFPLLHA